MQVRMANPRAGGRASDPLSPNDLAYESFAASTSGKTDISFSYMGYVAKRDNYDHISHI